jgi:effector-binding domain-containing protein
MKKKVILLSILIAVCAICFIPFTHQKTILIKASFFNVYLQMAKADNWKKWQPDISAALKKNPTQVKISKHSSGFGISTPNVTLNIKNVDGVVFNTEKTIDGKSIKYSYILLPGSAEGNTIAKTGQKTNLIKLLIGVFDDTDKNHDMDGLKNFMEDSRSYYGFEIKQTMVSDINIIVEKKTVPVKNKISGIIKIRQELDEFIKLNHLKAVQPVIADIRTNDPDSVRIMIGMPINKPVAAASDKIQFMHEPEHGKILIGLYKGRYGDRQKLYTAMKNYITDHYLASPEDPYEKYLDNKIPFSDTAFVNLQVNFPIY